MLSGCPSADAHGRLPCVSPPAHPQGVNLPRNALKVLSFGLDRTREPGLYCKRPVGKAQISLGKPKMARLEGFEPPTFSFEGCRSIHLSYRRITAV